MRLPTPRRRLGGTSFQRACCLAREEIRRSRYERQRTEAWPAESRWSAGWTAGRRPAEAGSAGAEARTRRPAGRPRRPTPRRRGRPALTSFARQLSPPVAAGGSFCGSWEKVKPCFPASHGLPFFKNAPTPHHAGSRKITTPSISYDDIAPGSVSFHHSLESDLGEREGKFGSSNPLAPFL
jgi:hypothetical protein